MEKIDEKNENNNNNILKTSCLCLTPIQKNNCNFCLSNSKEKNITNINIFNNNNNISSIGSANNVFFNKYVLDIHSQRKHYEGKLIYLI